MQLLLLSFIQIYTRAIFFVSDDDPTVITAIIDWQSSSIESAF